MSANLRQLGFQTQLVYGNLDWALAETQLIRGVNIAFAERFVDTLLGKESMKAIFQS